MRLQEDEGPTTMHEPSEHLGPPPARTDAAAFLVGSARSGTSLLYKALCLHRDAGYISNWVARFPSHPSLAVLNRVPRAFPSLRHRVWFDEESNAYVYGDRRPLLERLFPMPVEGEPVYRSCGIPQFQSEESRAIEGQRAALRSAVRRIQRFSGSRCFVNKRIANNRRISLLVGAFPGARFVEIVRDGRAVAYSLSRVDWWETSVVWWCGRTPRQWRAEGGDPWELCARNWVEDVRAVRQGLRAVPEAQVLTLSYEGFVREPMETLHRVARFVGLGVDPGWRAALRGLRFPNRNEAWRRDLDPAVVDRITGFQAEELETYGYR